MTITIILCVILIAIVLFTFSSRFSIIPFFPTHANDVSRIVSAMELKNDMIVFDLGAGTGDIIFAAALEAHKKGLNTQFVGIDINFFLYFIMLVRRLFHPAAHHITLICGDLFTYDYQQSTNPYTYATYYMYGAPWLTNPMAQLIQDTAHKSTIISYYYPIKSLPQKKHIEGVHDIFVYNVV